MATPVAVNQPANAQEESNEEAPEIVLIEHPEKAPLSYKPDLVRVRAMSRGFYAVRKVVEGTILGADGGLVEGNSVAREEIMRNSGDVFLMDTTDMRKWPLGAAPRGALTKKEYPHASEHPLVIIKTKRGQFELPSWVQLADDKGGIINKPTGHQTKFGKMDGQLIPNPS